MGWADEWNVAAVALAGACAGGCLEVEPEPPREVASQVEDLGQSVVTLWEHTGTGGAGLQLSGDVPFLGDWGWNDRASSLTVADGYAVTLYEHAWYGGRCQTFAGRVPELPFGVSTGFFASYALFNDDASSISVVRPRLCTLDADGCSTPTPSPYDGQFHEACVLHDRCYGTPGRWKGDCDVEFRDAMRAACAWWDAPCYAAAEVYFVAVGVGAQSSYDHDQERIRGCEMILDRGEVYYQTRLCY